jgi:hypothetical protein
MAGDSASCRTSVSLMPEYNIKSNIARFDGFEMTARIASVSAGTRTRDLPHINADGICFCEHLD